MPSYYDKHIEKICRETGNIAGHEFCQVSRITLIRHIKQKKS